MHQNQKYLVMQMKPNKTDENEILDIDPAGEYEEPVGDD